MAVLVVDDLDTWVLILDSPFQDVFSLARLQ